MLWYVPHRLYRCLTHHFTPNFPYKYNLIMGTPNYIYIRYGMVFQYQIVIFFYIISVYTVCHVDHHFKVHQVQKNFASSWQIVLVVIHSGICHAFWS